MAANNEVGTVQPVAEAAALAHGAGAVLLCDAVQAAGIPGVDMAGDGIDLLALAAHKLGGPTGVGALVVRSGITLRPLLHGGGQERGLRSGTLPAAALAGFGAAAAAALAERHSGAATPWPASAPASWPVCARSPPTWRSTATRGPGPRAGLPGLLSVRFPGRRAEDLLLLLDRHGVACSAGSACASGAVTPSHVLVAMGRDPAEARETVRFSLGHASTQADVDAAVAAVAQAPRGPRAGEGRGAAAPRCGAVTAGRQVLVAMSGGVDSSVAAALAVEEGWDVTGVHLKLADTPATSRCRARDAAPWPTPTTPGGSPAPSASPSTSGTWPRSSSGRWWTTSPPSTPAAAPPTRAPAATSRSRWSGCWPGPAPSASTPWPPATTPGSRAAACTGAPTRPRTSRTCSTCSARPSWSGCGCPWAG